MDDDETLLSSVLSSVMIHFKIRVQFNMSSYPYRITTMITTVIIVIPWRKDPSINLTAPYAITTTKMYGSQTFTQPYKNKT